MKNRFNLIIFCELFALFIALPAFADVAVNEAIFPDEIFRSYVSANFDTDNDGILTDSEISSVISIDVKDKGISSLQGIEYFTFLKWLDCSSSNSSKKNTFTTLDLSENIELLHLECSNSSLEELNLSNCSKLEYLKCGDWGRYFGTSIKTLDLTNCPNLKYLDCSRTGLNELDISNNPNLETLICYEVRLNTLDLTHNTKLKVLNCSRYFGEQLLYAIGMEYQGGSLKTMDLSKNSELTELICSYNIELTELDLSNNTKLETLDCSCCNLYELNLNKNIALKVLDCHSENTTKITNKLTTLDISNNKMLTKLDCSSNNLSELDFSNNTELTYLKCLNNKITEPLDVSKHTKLQHLEYSSAVKDLSNNTALTYLSCIGQIDVSNCANLSYLYCGGEELTSLNLENNAKLSEFSLVNSNITALNISDKKNLWSVNIENNDKLITINARNSFFELVNGVDCYGNDNLISFDLSGSRIGALLCGGNKLMDLNLRDCIMTGFSVINAISNSLALVELPVDTLSNFKNQRRLNVKLETNSDINYPYKFNFREVIPESKFGCIASETIKVHNASNDEIEFSYSDGIVYMKTKPAEIDYYSKVYFIDTNTYSSNKSMDVSLLFYGEPEITTSELPAGTVGEEYIFEFQAETGAVATWSISGDLPSGLSLDINTGIISGIPTETWNASFDITAINKAGKNLKTFTLLINDNSKKVEINATNFPDSEFRNYVSNNLDKDKNGYLSGEEILNVKKIDYYLSWNPTHSFKGIEYFSELVSLNFMGLHELYSLDVSQNTKLEYLDCRGSYSALQELTIGNNEHLKYLDCGSNRRLKTLNVSKLVNLESLFCYADNLSELDVSQNTKLKELACSNNNLEALDLSNNFNLEILDCCENKLTALNLSNNTKLKKLKCEFNGTADSANNLETLDLSNNTNLEELDCRGNKLTALNLSNNIKLKKLYCDSNNLITLDLGNNSDLRDLSCESNNLTTLDVSRNPNLESLYCGNNNISVLDLSNNTKLGLLGCWGNNLTVLDVSNNAKLDYLSCGNNQLTTLILGDNAVIYYLNCEANNLTTLDISNNPKFYTLYCASNDLEELILGENTTFQNLYCQNNPNLKDLDISGCPNLTEFIHDDSLTVYDGKAKPEFKTHSLMLDGQIGVNFYMDLPEISEVDYYDGQKCYMEFDIKGDNTANNPQPFDEEFMNRSKTYYGFRCYTNSVQMADPITATFHYGENQTITHEYSVSEYLDTAISKTTSDTERELMEAIKDYGYYAQQYLSRYHNWTVGVEHLAMSYANDYSDEDIEEARLAVENYEIERDVGNSGIEKVTYSLNLDSETIINVYLTVSSNYTGSVSAYFDGGTENVAVKQQDGRYKIEISDIAAHLLGKTYVITVNAGETFYVKVSALSYVKTVLNASQAQTDEKKTVTALYNYYVTTMDYRKSQGYND